MHALRILLTALAAVVAFVQAPVQAAEEGAEAPKVTLTWVGCGISKKAYMKEVAALYEKKTGVHIEISGGGATKGIRDVAGDAADIGGSCRFTLPNEEAEKDARLVPVAWDALVVIVNPDNPVDDMTLQQLRDIFDGKITNWKEVGGPDAPIHVLARQGKISGVGRTVRELVFADADKDIAATEFFPSSGPLEKAVQSDVNAIGITGISSARKRKVKMLKLEGKEPSYDNILSGDYLLYRPLYLAYKPDSKNAEEVKKFIQFVHGHEGQEVLRKNGTVPYLEGIHLIRKKMQQARQARERGL